MADVVVHFDETKCSDDDCEMIEFDYVLAVVAIVALIISLCIHLRFDINERRPANAAAIYRYRIKNIEKI
ncbi:hypothetical protein DERF_004049 [Dermatophagoides farinae]|uniref:Uncharacterized protein n=1 Tax=Dermatophagoides farinae TaxID=6954 RepID=A0A922LDS0_DERFA|nr:hypothetical protein DERF_004049 [Dermatophagoides farinae]